jgi:hypothetical protein
VQFQHAGSLVQGCAGGQHVIDKPDARALQVILAEEGVARVLAALLAAGFRLGPGGAAFHEAFRIQRQTCGAGKVTRNFQCASAFRMEEKLPSAAA